MDKCVFCQIGAGDLPAEFVFENEEFVAFRDLKPIAPIHVILIPKRHFATFMDVNDVELLGRAMHAVQKTAESLQLDQDGFRTVINCKGNGGQTVYHLHIHILGGRFMSWPPG